MTESCQPKLETLRLVTGRWQDGEGERVGKGMGWERGERRREGRDEKGRTRSPVGGVDN